MFGELVWKEVVLECDKLTFSLFIYSFLYFINLNSYLIDVIVFMPHYVGIL